MVSEKLYRQIEKLKVKPGKLIKLKDYNTAYKGNLLNKQEAEELLEEGRKKLSQLQDELYAHNHYSILIILQAMDTAGKDGAVKHILSGVNPLGVKVFSFKAPNAEELDHDFLWRHYKALPARGEIAIHNRSHYENVLVTRIHPEYILNEHLPGIDSVDKINHHFWKSRFKQINRFEKNLVKNGTIILKFFLHLSKEEQNKRLLSRIEDPSKNWKFDMNDMRERMFWDQYQQAYEEAINATSTKEAPWFIIPADDKWYARLAIASIIDRQFESLKIEYPQVSEAQREVLQKAREQLLQERGPDISKTKKSK
jgi:PPK2 family polyphosphate:nucleotide phosphotransferase